MRLTLTACLLLLLPNLPAHALYDPAPDPSLAAVQGAWVGTLQYQDYQQPGRMVSLPTRLYVAAAGPNALTLYYVFDDGPGKTVHSYERMDFDFVANKLAWTSGADAPQRCSLLEAGPASASRNLVFECVDAERPDARPTARHTLTLSSEALTLQKVELRDDGSTLLRNRYAFKRAGAAMQD